jgi:CIC family chloride channel protein
MPGGGTTLRSVLTPRRLSLLEALIIGLVAGLSGLAVKQGVHLLGAWRMNEAAHCGPFPASLLGLPLIGLVGGLISGWLVERVAPETSGSGIPQVKAVLHRVPIKFDLRVAVVKLFGGIVALGSGMPLGREGPTVQVGAALAASLERWMPTSPQHRRNLLAAGAGAGLAAAFNAPIAGVLFVAEELLKDMSSFTLGTAILACFVASIVAQGYRPQASSSRRFLFMWCSASSPAVSARSSTRAY